MTLLQKAAATAALAVVAATTVSIAPAVAAAPMQTTGTRQAATACGWRTDWTGHAYYNHCGTGNVVIFVDRLNIGGIRDYEQCVTPGDHYLGDWPDFQGAWYAGKTC
ncbi:MULTISPECIES: DUF6355 family natural product biosynthesis protein [Streptomyces]|uniref:DUF6355 family natural product biosynthesis protein n=1 Tax=Streptomyces eurythermus TaxID=42237 RepID=A0ABW6Z9B3_9ACTN|nr:MULTISPECIES: DUF6355 family natural product biosynthesis protein [Streptomyces]QIS75105.1 hypothetical protein HB370_38345 [Streptomyces sp. DSM 40868]